MVAATGARVIAHHKAGGRISGVDRGVQAGDVIKARNMFQRIKRYDKSFYDVNDRLRDLGR